MKNLFGLLIPLFSFSQFALADKARVNTDFSASITAEVVLQKEQEGLSVEAKFSLKEPPSVIPT